MLHWLEKILSWSPLLLLLLIPLTAWQFLHFNGEAGGRDLLSPACPGEQLEERQQGGFLVLYRLSGCQEVSALRIEEFLNDIRWWSLAKEKFSLGDPRRNTAIDLRSGKFSIQFLFGRPGALSIPNTSREQRRYYLAKGLASLLIRETSPDFKPQTASLLSGALALNLLERDTFRVNAPKPERELSRKLPVLWPEIVSSCQRCSPQELLEKINQ